MSLELKLYCDNCTLTVTMCPDERDEYEEIAIPQDWFIVTNRNYKPVGVHYCPNCKPKTRTQEESE